MGTWKHVLLSPNFTERLPAVVTRDIVWGVRPAGPSWPDWTELAG